MPANDNWNPNDPDEGHRFFRGILWMFPLAALCWLAFFALVMGWVDI